METYAERIRKILSGSGGLLRRVELCFGGELNNCPLMGAAKELLTIVDTIPTQVMASPGVCFETFDVKRLKLDQRHIVRRCVEFCNLFWTLQDTRGTVLRTVCNPEGLVNCPHLFCPVRMGRSGEIWIFPLENGVTDPNNRRSVREPIYPRL